MLNDEKELQYYRSAEIQTIINEGKEYKKNLLEDYNKSLEILNNERNRINKKLEEYSKEVEQKKEELNNGISEYNEKVNKESKLLIRMSKFYAILIGITITSVIFAIINMGE